MKYIIEFEDEPTAYEDGMTFYACKQIPYWSMSKGQLNRLTPYTEPNRKAIEDEVWSFSWKMFNMDIGEYAEIFGDNGCPSDYREAKAKYEAWKKQKDELRVGDEVVDTETDKGVVTYIRGYVCDVLWDDGGVTEEVEKEELYKTGRHFPEIAELLKKMRDSDD